MQVRRQSVDVASLLFTVSETVQAEHYLFMEDDLVACDNLFTAISHVLVKVRP